MPTAEEIAALRQALSEAVARGEELAGELRVVRTERDLLKEQLNRFKRQLFDASAAPSCRATRWPPASCGWARRRSRCST
jgi:transposase